jgi:hypothetical protein
MTHAQLLAEQYQKRYGFAREKQVFDWQNSTKNGTVLPESSNESEGD